MAWGPLSLVERGEIMATWRAGPAQRRRTTPARQNHEIPSSSQGWAQSTSSCSVL